MYQFHNHQTHSFPADKHIPVAEMRAVEIGGDTWSHTPYWRKQIKKTHCKRSRAWAKQLARQQLEER